MNNFILIIFGGVMVLWYVATCRGVPPVEVTIPVSANQASVSVKKANISTGNNARCRTWHTVSQGETQWRLAVHYADNQDKNAWLDSMRWISGKASDDNTLRVNETVCVEWE